ncbi:MAG: rhodanese-like domain-containing protein [Cocleimonas sp.]|nr:rhodanese-like domain-containing protein [Cocleimonas sp.]
MFGIQETDAAGLKEMLDKDTENKIRLIDVRSQAEYARGIIEGGEFLPLHTLPAKYLDLSEEEEIVIYCGSGNRSAQACMFLAQNTNIKATNLRGGLFSWYQAGLEIVAPNTAPS